MNDVDASEHFQAPTDDETPSVCAVIVDTNPRAWAALASTGITVDSNAAAGSAGDTAGGAITLSNAIANLLVFVNAHLALSAANRVAVIASHCNRAVWLFPSLPKSFDSCTDVAMPDVVICGEDVLVSSSRIFSRSLPASANKFPPFAEVESSVALALRDLMASTCEQEIASTTTTNLSGALSMALCHVNKATVSLAAARPAPSDSDRTRPLAPNASLGPLCGRVFILSVSDSEPAQYIPTMNVIFAAAHARIPIDTLSLMGEATFLQQAAFITGGTFVSAAASPPGLLAYLMIAFAFDAQARASLAAPARPTVDFRAACFCHGRVVSDGFVCSICLSILCDIPNPPECPTCGTILAVGSYGAKPAVTPRKKKKKKRIANGDATKECLTAGQP